MGAKWIYVRVDITTIPTRSWVCVAWCWGGGHVKWCHEVAKPVLAAACNYICTDSFEIQAKRAYYDEEESENGLRTSPYRLSHFVAPLYVAPSTTPSNATSHRRVLGAPSAPPKMHETKTGAWWIVLCVERKSTQVLLYITTFRRTGNYTPV